MIYGSWTPWSNTGVDASFKEIFLVAVLILGAAIASDHFVRTNYTTYCQSTLFSTQKQCFPATVKKHGFPISDYEEIIPDNPSIKVAPNLNTSGTSDLNPIIWIAFGALMYYAAKRFYLSRLS